MEISRGKKKSKVSAKSFSWAIYRNVIKRKNNLRDKPVWEVLISSVLDMFPKGFKLCWNVQVEKSDKKMCTNGWAGLESRLDLVSKWNYKSWRYGLKRAQKEKNESWGTSTFTNSRGRVDKGIWEWQRSQNKWTLEQEWSMTTQQCFHETDDWKFSIRLTVWGHWQPWREQ